MLVNHINKNSLNYDEKNNPLVKRVFLTSSRKYKKFRTSNAISTITKSMYISLPFPKFIWVAEISLYDAYQEKKIFCEIVLDATASRYEALNSLIMIRVGDIVAYRLPNEEFSELNKRLRYRVQNFDIESLLYENNLEMGGK